jgi:acyl-CoA dehydrogenase
MKRDKKMDQRGAHTCDSVFYNCRVPAVNLIGGTEGNGLIAMTILDKGRLQIAAVAQRMVDDSLRYAMERRQFGQPIDKSQLIQAMLADRKPEIPAVRCMILDAAYQRDEGRNVSTEASAKLFASKTCGVADWTVLTHGGAGYASDSGIDRFCHDVWPFRIYESITQIQQQIVIARNMICNAAG